MIIYQIATLEVGTTFWKYSFQDTQVLTSPSLIALILLTGVIRISAISYPKQINI